MTPQTPTAPHHLPTSLGALRASGHQFRSVKAEIRSNLLAAMQAADPDVAPRWPGIVGFDDTVLPDLERALLAGHDLVLLGERGQGKTRLLRSLTAWLDEWTPMIAVSELMEHPYAPITPAMQRAATELGDELPVTWVHRSKRYAEKLATPDTSIGDLIGDVDPIKVAQGRTLGDPETIHYGLLPRMHRGIFAVNELPDLAERIQVGLLNALEERDIQVRGHTLRLPLDLLLVASANPEDYTNRGRIITPLKDRFGAEIRTHYPLDVDLEMDLIRGEAHLVAQVPAHVIEVVARFAQGVRDSAAVDDRSGVSARFSIAAAETIAATALRRAALTGELSSVSPDHGSMTPDTAVARISDAVGITATLRGKVEFEAEGEGRELEVLDHLLRVATADTWRRRLGPMDLSDLVGVAAADTGVLAGDGVTSSEVLGQFERIPGLGELLRRLGMDDAPGPAQAASAVEFALEGLHLTRRLAKDVLDDGRTVYGGRHRGEE